MAHFMPAQNPPNRPSKDGYRIPIVAPCAECAHESVCAIKAVLDAERFATLMMPALLPALTPLAAGTRHVIVDCAEFLDRARVSEQPKPSLVDRVLAEPESAQSALDDRLDAELRAPAREAAEPESAQSALKPAVQLRYESQHPDDRDRRMFAAIRAAPEATTYVAVDQALGLTPSTTYGRLALLSKHGTLPPDIEQWRDSRRGRGRPKVRIVPGIDGPAPLPVAEPAGESFEDRRHRNAREAADRTWRQLHPGEPAPVSA